MPELPEVETVANHLRKIIPQYVTTEIAWYETRLRTPVATAEVEKVLKGQPIKKIFRRSKYILIETAKGYVGIHLGMTGQLLLAKSSTPAAKHTHVVFSLQSGRRKNSAVYLHFVDPRRFGCMFAIFSQDWSLHPLLAHLGPEPLDIEDLGQHLWKTARGCKAPIKNFIMNAAHVVGVGNIYASESLFRAKIRPTRQAGSLSQEKFNALGTHICQVLKEAIAAGGTTFSDFRQANGEQGYFAVNLSVYDRGGEPCPTCRAPLKQIRQAGRSTFYCAKCQS